MDDNYQGGGCLPATFPLSLSQRFPSHPLNSHPIPAPPQKTPNTHTAVANSWRTTPDIRDEWRSVMEILEVNARRWRHARPGAFNDPDMLEVGEGFLWGGLGWGGLESVGLAVCVLGC